MGDPKITPVKVKMALLNWGKPIDRPLVTVYLPFKDAEFGAQRAISDPRVWLIVHLKTSLLVPVFLTPDYATRAEALIDAYRLSVACPHAAAVRYVDGKLAGDMKRMRDEVVAALRPEAA